MSDILYVFLEAYIKFERHIASKCFGFFHEFLAYRLQFNDNAVFMCIVDLDKDFYNVQHEKMAKLLKTKDPGLHHSKSCQLNYN